MSNKTYDTIKILALLILPIGALIATVGSIWGIPYGEQIQQTCIALDTFAGVIVTIAKAKWDEQHGGGNG